MKTLVTMVKVFAFALGLFALAGGARVTAEEYQEKHARRLKASTEDIKRGIGRVSESPGVAAAAQENKMLTNVTEAVSSGRWARKVAAVPLEAWKKRAIEKGVGRISAGIDAAKPEQVAMAGRLLAATDEVGARVREMPSTTLDDNIARMSEFARGMAGKKGSI